MRANKYIEKAFECLNDKNDLIANGQLKDPKFQAYANGFGATVIMSGIKATLLMYSDKAKDNKHVLNVLTKMIYPKEYTMGENSWDFIKKEITAEKTNAIRGEYTEASIALKLALRTFPRAESSKEGGCNDE